MYILWPICFVPNQAGGKDPDPQYQNQNISQDDDRPCPQNVQFRQLGQVDFHFRRHRPKDFRKVKIGQTPRILCRQARQLPWKESKLLDLYDLDDLHQLRKEMQKVVPLKIKKKLNVKIFLYFHEFQYLKKYLPLDDFEVTMEVSPENGSNLKGSVNVVCCWLEDSGSLCGRE